MSDSANGFWALVLGFTAGIIGIATGTPTLPVLVIFCLGIVAGKL